MPRRPICSAIFIVQHRQRAWQGKLLRLQGEAESPREHDSYHSLKRPCSTSHRIKRWWFVSSVARRLARRSWYCSWSCINWKASFTLKPSSRRASMSKSRYCCCMYKSSFVSSTYVCLIQTSSVHPPLPQSKSTGLPLPIVVCKHGQKRRGVWE